jgi:two-component sensor histidine kinase
MDAYLSGLVDELSRTIRSSEHAVHIRLVAEPIRVETDKAVPIGLMVNELVTNALKYAYPAGAPGIVRVSLGRIDADIVQLVVEDDGIGYPDEQAAPTGSGLGSMIVTSMAQALRASVALDRSHAGTRFVVSLPA